MTTSFAHSAGLGICAVLGGADVVGLGGNGQDGAPPAAVLVTGAVLGVVTLVAAWRARNQRPGWVAVVIGSRALSAVLSLPVHFADDAPAWASFAVTVGIALTILGSLLVLPALRRPTAATAMGPGARGGVA